MRHILGISLLFVVACLLTSLLVSTRQAASAGSQSRGEALARKSDCLSCHAVDRKVVGPAFVSVAKRYAGKPGALDKLVAKVRNGGAGNWGSVAMTPHPNVPTSDLRAMVTWVLSLKASSKKVSSSIAPGKTYTYTLSGGKKVSLDFPVFKTGQEVTHPIFSGWERFDSYCFRCHGTDAVGGELAPDLRMSLQGGLTKDQFISTALAGRPGKGMPSWAGFFSQAELMEVYQYVKARSVGLVAAGRPAGQ
ncbi:MAG: c-type cytochrome [Candidatus Eremiobacter antarcticus]|nr:c-type cytochrome [Candidatus Eremiobacteraeota bacterium]MBC5808303.1 c-type cytochrome [Candidatus Eremiobacteraeota bacterium]